MPTIAEIKATLKKQGVSGYSQMNKPELMKLLKSSKGRASLSPKRGSPLQRRMQNVVLPSSLGRAKSIPRVPQFTSPSVRGRSLPPPVPQFTSPKSQSPPSYNEALQYLQNRRMSPPRPAPSTIESRAKHRFIELSVANGVSKTQAEHNWLASQVDDDVPLISFDMLTNYGSAVGRSGSSEEHGSSRPAKKKVHPKMKEPAWNGPSYGVRAPAWNFCGSR